MTRLESSKKANREYQKRRAAKLKESQMLIEQLKDTSKRTSRLPTLSEFVEAGGDTVLYRWLIDYVDNKTLDEVIEIEDESPIPMSIFNKE